MRDLGSTLEPVTTRVKSFGCSVAVVAALITFLVVAGPVRTIPAGHVGVKDFFGSVSSGVLRPGIRLVVPMTRVVDMSIQTQEVKELAEVPSREGLILTLEASLLFQLDPAKAAELQQQQWLAALGMLEPQRGLGYGAMSDLASLYGYALPQYTPLNQLASGQAWQAGAPIPVGGKKPEAQILGQAVNPIGGNDNRRFGGTIDPVTGTVDVNSKNPERDALATALAAT